MREIRESGKKINKRIGGHNMKKLISLLLTLCMLLALCACGAKSDTSNDTPDPGTDNVEKTWSPERAVNVIVCKGAGGPTDTAVRTLMKYCEKHDANFTATIENVNGANGLTGMTKGALADGDGYTMAAIVVELAMMQNIASYQSAVTTDDFRAVNICVCNPVALCVRAGEYTDIYDFLDKVTASTKIGNAGTYGIGDITTTAMMAGWNKEYTPVPYSDGESANMQALLSKEVDAIVCAPSATLNSQVEAGDIQILCVVGNDRLTNCPDVPVISELENGYAQDLNVNAWAGLAVPKDTPDEIYDYLVNLCTEASNDPDFLAELNATGSVASAINGADAQAFLDNDAAFYAEMLKDAE